jgi:C1A family cysteine protease/Leucine-rich repeat (LRR) protein
MKNPKRIVCLSLVFITTFYAELIAQAGGTGLAHTPFKSRPFFASAKPIVAAEDQTLPPRFDLREQGRLTPVGDQGQLGTCWDFASIGALESNLATSLDPKADEFSEQNLRNRHGFAKPGSEGGNASMALAYFARWSGPVPESFDPYTDDPSKTKSPAPEPGTITVRLLDADFIPDKNYSAIKRELMRNGAIYSSIDVGEAASAAGEPGMEAYYDEKTFAFYKPESLGANHSIAIVGWDDNFPKTKFKTVNGKRPAKDGAFIVRNSWGADWGDKGYFYVSYEDAMIGTENASFVADAASRYNRIYQYDRHGQVEGIDVSGDEALYAVRFTAKADEDLQAVGLFINSENVECLVSTGPSRDKAAAAEPLAKAKPRWPGYHTLSLGRSYPLSAGVDFWIVVRVRGENGTLSIPIEKKEEGYISKIALAENACFAALDGKTFQDVGSSYKGNIPLKALSTARNGNTVIKVSRVAFEDSLVTMTVGEKRRFRIEVLPENATDRSVEFAVDKDKASLVKIGKDGEVTAEGPGELELIAVSSDKSIADRCRIVIAAAAPSAIAFDDPIFERAVRESIGKLSGPLVAADLGRLKALKPAGRLGSLASVALLPALESLDLSETTSPVDISPLARVKRLKSLSLAGLRYAELGTLAKLDSLESLDISGTKVTDFSPLSSLPRLSALAASGLMAPSLAPLASIASLRRLDLRDDGLKDITPLTKLGALEALFLSGNSIRDFSPLKAIYPKLAQRDFEISAAKVAFADPRLAEAVRKALKTPKGEDIPKDRLARIRSLDLSAYSDGKPFDLAGIENLVGLDELVASGLGIVDASPLAALKRIESIDLSDNEIADISFAAKLPNLVSLDLSSNKIADIAPLAGLTNLEELYLGDNSIEDIAPLSGLKSLAELELEGNKIVSLQPISHFDDLEVLDVSANKIEDFSPIARLGGLSSLFVRDNPSRDFTKLASIRKTLGEYDFELDGKTFDPDSKDYDGDASVDDQANDQQVTNDDRYDYQDENRISADDDGSGGGNDKESGDQSPDDDD